MLKYYKNRNGIYLHFKGNRLPVFMELFLSVEQNRTLKMRNNLSPFISEVPTAARFSVQVPAPGEGERHNSILESFFLKSNGMFPL